MNTQYNLDRFVKAQCGDYQTALSEIKKGRKRSHWMWYIFPQLKGLGRSPTSEFYGIASLEEAAAFLENPYLGGNRKILSGPAGHPDLKAVEFAIECRFLSAQCRFPDIPKAAGSIAQEILRILPFARQT